MKAIFSSEFISPDEVVSQQIDVLGPMPSRWWERWEGQSRFFENGRPKGDRYAWPSIDEAFEEGVQRYRQKRGMGEFGEKEKAAILDLMRRMLVFEPAKRLTVKDVLRSEWMSKWVLPCLE